MHWLNVRYSPGFQEDLTSWTLSIEPDGRLIQDADVCLFSPFEQRKETYHFRLTLDQLTDLRTFVSALPFDEIAAAANQFVIDDTEQITVTHFSDGGSSSFTAPLEWWAYKKSLSDEQSPAILAAIDLWRRILPLSQYKGSAAGA